MNLLFVFNSNLIFRRIIEVYAISVYCSQLLLVKLILYFLSFGFVLSLLLNDIIWKLIISLIFLMLNPGDSFMDIRQFLLDARKTYSITFCDLLLHTKDGYIHHPEDFNEIYEVDDITAGGCSLEMVPGIYECCTTRTRVFYCCCKMMHKIIVMFTCFMNAQNL